jgi:hypothetical protein
VVQVQEHFDCDGMPNLDLGLGMNQESSLVNPIHLHRRLGP